MPIPHRNRALIDYQPAVSNAREVLRMVWGSVCQDAYPALHLGARCLVEVSGGPGDGKSTFSLRLANALRPALLVSAEENIGPTLARRFNLCGVRSDSFHVISRATVDQVVSFAQAKNVNSVIIDSVQECAWTASELRHLLSMIPSLTVLIAILQITKSGTPAGAMALQHECDVHVAIRKMAWWLVKSRYQPLDGVGGEVLPPNHFADLANDETEAES